MNKVIMWFVAYFLVFAIFAGTLPHDSVGLDVLVLTSTLTCAVTFTYTYCLYDRITMRPRLMMALFLIPLGATWLCSELLLSRALETELSRRAETIRKFCGEKDILDERFSQELLELAEGGDMGAQRCVGKCYLDGHGVESDMVAAVKWYRLAAEHGDVHAQFRLGWFYDRGLGVSPDAHEAEKWLRMAAERNPFVQAYLGLCYMRGFCRDMATRDISEAARWFGVAAEMGYLQAKEFLAMIGRQERLHRRKVWMLALALAAVVIAAFTTVDGR